MEAPDKIYLHPDIGGREFIRPWLPRAANSESVAYIRKDALLEWAEEMKEQIGLGLNAYDMGEENGKADILNALIDKLNSM